VGQTVAVVGHPANDSKRNPDGALLQAFFQGHFNVKRLQPGLITGVDSTIFRHDCTTMGGSSGSPLLNVETGEVLGIHSRGEFMLHNSAVSATVLADWYAQ
jgi:endonuclease G